VQIGRQAAHVQMSPAVDPPESGDFMRQGAASNDEQTPAVLLRDRAHPDQ
jgi:hypothetical protein